MGIDSFQIKRTMKPRTAYSTLEAKQQANKQICAIIVGKKRDPRIQDPVIFSSKIRKNRKNSEKYFFPKNLGKIRKNSEKYFEKFGKIAKKNLKIRKNRKNSEK